MKKQNNEFVIALASAKRQIWILDYDSKESAFKFQMELQLPDSAKSLNWSGDKLCVGFKREYSLVDPAGTPPKTLFATGERQLTTCGVTLPDELIALINGTKNTID